jgi:outer membrane protein OmpA-like peptidoglycan-associated protein
VEKDMQAEVIVTMISDGMVSVASKAPIAVKVEDFGLLPAIEKLQQAANVTDIVPTASVSFDFVFTAEGQPSAPAPAVVAATAPAVTPVAVEAGTPEPTGAIGPVETDASKTVYSDEECFNRFDVLSRTGAIHFRVASDEVDPSSRPVLDAVLDVVGKCPRLMVEVAGHTDSDGSDAANQLLSERRAEAVATFIRAAGIPAEQVAAAGYGETQPIAPNDTRQNKALNRRIEFAASPLVN